MTNNKTSTGKFSPRVHQKTTRFLILRCGAIVLRVERRALVVSMILAALIVILIIVGLLGGAYPMKWWEAVVNLFGVGNDPLGQFIVQHQRAPRVFAAILVGSALGVSGTIFQSLSANPLGSPDIIGFTVGSATGALVEIIIFNGGPSAVALAAVIGGFLTAFVVYLLSWRGGLSGFRLVLIGIGVSTMLGGVNSLLVVRASLSAAQNAAQWLSGSLNMKTWTETFIIFIVVLVLLPITCVLSRPLGVMMMGDDTALSLGIHVERTRAYLVFIGVAFVAVSVAVAGPISFVALAATQLARRLTHTSGIGVATSALMGSGLILGSDLIAQRLLPTQLPVGVVTGVLGGAYLICLLAREWRHNPA